MEEEDDAFAMLDDLGDLGDSVEAPPPKKQGACRIICIYIYIYIYIAKDNTPPPLVTTQPAKEADPFEDLDDLDVMNLDD